MQLRSLHEPWVELTEVDHNALRAANQSAEDERFVILIALLRSPDDGRGRGNSYD